jgi:hypothetical protein
VNATARKLDRQPELSLVERTAKAVEYGCRDMAAGLAELLEQLPKYDDVQKRADQLEDAKDTYFRALSWTCAYTFGLCLMCCKDPNDAGCMYRKKEVQEELRARAMRVALYVLST